jgi:hypothetical protein
VKLEPPESTTARKSARIRRQNAQGGEQMTDNRCNGTRKGRAWLLAACLIVAAAPVGAQRNGSEILRRSDGKPDLSGIWQALGTAHWDLLDHSPQPGPLYRLGAIGAVPGGRGVVVGDTIPYQPWAAEKRQENFANRLTEDPEIKCYMPGVPRATYLPFPFQIVQTQRDILISYEFANADRKINMGEPTEFPYGTWMGWSNGHWDGDTLVVDVTGLNGLSWLDRAGNFVSENAHIVERYTPIDADHIRYEAAIEDPTVFTDTWTIRLPLYRRIEENAQLVEFRCVEFTEELLYGQYRKKPSVDRPGDPK